MKKMESVFGEDVIRKWDNSLTGIRAMIGYLNSDPCLTSTITILKLDLHGTRCGCAYMTVNETGPSVCSSKLKAFRGIYL